MMDEIKATNSSCETDNNKNLPEQPDNNPYAYLDRNEFTSEKFKLEVRGLPRFYGMKELKKLFNNKLQLNCTKIKVPSKNNYWIYVCFRSEEDKANALKVLNNYKWKYSTLKVEEAKPVPDPLVQKRIQNLSENEVALKKPKLEISLEDQVKDASTSWWRLTYEEQLEKKTLLASTVLKKLGRSLVRMNGSLPKGRLIQKSKHKELRCELLPIRHAECSQGYRNKCQFTVGMNDVTGERTVGFRLCSYVKGSVNVGPIDGALNVPERMKVAVKIFEKFVRNSDLDVFNPENHKGYWQQLTARYGFKTDELMLIVGINPQNMPTAELENLKKKLQDYFMEGEGKECRVTSLYLQQIKMKQSREDIDRYDHIAGQTHITERLLGRTFRISPQAFFQVNTNAAEILYESIGELADLTPDVTLLDVCCGTGTIGISLSDKCGEVLGLEISPEAIADAEVNASTNNVTNAKFFAGKAEVFLSSVAYRATKNDIVAVVDPPRPGLRQKALLYLRQLERIKRLVYVSCNPTAALKNFVDLGRGKSKIFKGEPFLPVKAILVDLFPFTPHSELIVYFERSSYCRSIYAEVPKETEKSELCDRTANVKCEISYPS